MNYLGETGTRLVISALRPWLQCSCASGLRLDGKVDFSGRKQNWILCLHQHSFSSVMIVMNFVPG